MFSQFWSLGIKGINGFLIRVEVDISRGLPSYSIVGLPDVNIKESKDRVLAAIRNSGFDAPTKKVTVNLSPAQIKKAGSHYDLPIALAILKAGGKIDGDPDLAARTAFIGELSLDGKLTPVRGVLPMILSLVGNETVDSVVVPEKNAGEASLSGKKVFAASDLREVAAYLGGGTSLRRVSAPEKEGKYFFEGDFSEVKNQVFAKRALEIAAAGFHNLIMIGPPGSGKSMLARRFSSILPLLSSGESLEVTKIYSVAGLLDKGIVRRRPFRDPHHTISDAALIGGGTNPRPGEVSLAHCGVLFLDEFAEFSRPALESLREPLETRSVRISRVRDNVRYPAKFILIAAMNPCPCGYLGHPVKECMCTPLQIRRYQLKISGPVLDRIDMHIQLSPIRYSQWSRSGESEPSEKIRERVLKAMEIQKERFGEEFRFNFSMKAGEMKNHCKMDDESGKMIEIAMDKFGYSARSVDKALKVARTIADIESSESIRKEHIAEALQYRVLDRRDLAGKY